MSGAVEYIKGTVLPIAFLGLVGASVNLAYEFPFDKGESIKTFVDNAITKMLTWLNMSPDKGAGYLIMMALNLFVQGILIALAIFIATRFINVPGPGRVVAPLADL